MYQPFSEHMNAQSAIEGPFQLPDFKILALPRSSMQRGWKFECEDLEQDACSNTCDA
jgi:hypothetical protein